MRYAAASTTANCDTTQLVYQCKIHGIGMIKIMHKLKTTVLHNTCHPLASNMTSRLVPAMLRQIHRIQAVNKDGSYQTKGDANPTADPAPVAANYARATRAPRAPDPARRITFFPAFNTSAARCKSLAVGTTNGACHSDLVCCG